ncbi:hypothetical protein SAMN05421507_10771 [Lentzea jiangxiensis]|uniref:Uncharacterized protein n=1 Tax=Lentzea jiangxiensis TaxID=641025 RepID=A0A1H0RTE4_9PSEU|nr:hypothetical protein SAMN05421507_10771 [Lentzea jiangxiensis]
MNSRDASIPVIADAPDGSTGVGEVLVRAAISAADTA